MNYLSNYETERLIIRPLTEEDTQPWLEFISDKECMTFLPSPAHMSLQQQTEYWMNRQFLRYKENRYGLMALVEKETGNLAGQCGLLLQEIEGEQVMEIGYHLLKKYWGKGYATEAASFFKELAFKNDYSKELVSIIDEGNTASEQVARRNGMTWKKASTYTDLPVNVYSISNSGK